MKKKLILGVISVLSILFVNNNLLSDVKELGSVAEFNQVVKNRNDNKLVVLKLHLSGCPHCVSLAPKYLDLSKNSNFSNVEFVSIEYNKAPQVAQSYRISQFPAVIYIKNGNEVGRTVNCTKAAIEAKIRELNK